MPKAIDTEPSRTYEPSRSQEQGFELLIVRSDLSCARFRDIVLICQPVQNPSDASWNEWIEWSTSHSYRAVLISTHGGGLSAKQRSRLADARKQRGLPPEKAALLTDSAILRGVLTAMAWISGADVMPFASDNLPGALAWLHLGEHYLEVSALLARMHAAMAAAAS